MLHNPMTIDVLSHPMPSVLRGGIGGRAIGTRKEWPQPYSQAFEKNEEGAVARRVGWGRVVGGVGTIRGFVGGSINEVGEPPSE